MGEIAEKEEVFDTKERIRALEGKLDAVEKNIIDAITERDKGLRSFLRSLIQAVWSGVSQAYNEMKKEW